MLKLPKSKTYNMKIDFKTISVALLLLCFSMTKLCAQDSINTKASKFQFRDIFILPKKLDSNLCLLFKLDDRITFIRNEPTDITGLQFGLQKRNWKLWLGYAEINTPSRTRIVQEKNQNVGKNDTIKFNNDLKFGTISSEYIVVWRRYYEISAAAGIGFGVLEINRENLSQNTSLTNKGFFVPIEPAIKFVIKPSRWVGFSGSIGYRQTLSLATNNFNYNGWFYSYGVSLFLGNIYSDVKKMIR
jgi:hypothetical protein